MPEQQIISPWKYKPWWCQPWSIVLTTVTLISGSWLIFKIIWLTILVAIPLLIWMGFFLLIWPQMMIRSGVLDNFEKTSLITMTTEIIIPQINNSLISIIIPTLNEADNIQSAINSTKSSTNIEIIVVDGGSEDETLLIAKSLNIKVIISPPGRANQMNIGAMAASGEILLFLHADTRLPTNFDQMIRTTLAKPGIVAGAFTLQINSPHWGLRLVEFGVKWRCNLWQMPYGDQGIFITKDVFQQVGNFPQIPIMEDFELMRKLKTLGKIYLLPTPVITSPRRWLKKGILQTTLGNQIIIIAYLLGISPNQIRNWYSSPKL